MKKKSIIFILVLMALLSNITTSVAHDKYWIFFTQKTKSQDSQYVSKAALANRVMLNLELHQYTDVPVNESFIQVLQEELAVEILNISKWFNAASARLDQDQIEFIKQLPFVEGVRKITSEMVVMSVDEKSQDISQALRQINSSFFFQNNLSGKGVKIGLIDGAFAPGSSTFKKLTKAGR